MVLPWRRQSLLHPTTFPSGHSATVGPVEGRLGLRRDAEHPARRTGATSEARGQQGKPLRTPKEASNQPRSEKRSTVRSTTIPSLSHECMDRCIGRSSSSAAVPIVGSVVSVERRTRRAERSVESTSFCASTISPFTSSWSYTASRLAVYCGEDTLPSRDGEEKLRACSFDSQTRT